MRVLLALSLALSLVLPAHAEPYSRDLYKHWIDADHDCQDTRNEVLIAESAVRAALNAKGCVVTRGKWLDPYTGKTFTAPRQLDVDHLVPLAEVHRSGGDRWTAKRRQDYANNLSDPNTLIAVALGANRSKGDRDPARWLPPSRAFQCTYVTRWVEVKRRWALTMDAAEKQKVNAVLRGCSVTSIIAAPRSLPALATPRPPPALTRLFAPRPLLMTPIRAAKYGQRCDCPYDRDVRGARCGARSAHDKSGGTSAVCFVGEQVGLSRR